MTIKKILLSLLVVPCLMGVLTFSSNAAIQVKVHESANYPKILDNVKTIINTWNLKSDLKIFEFNNGFLRGNQPSKVDNTTIIYMKNFKTDKSLPLIIRQSYSDDPAYCDKGDIYLNTNFPWAAGDPTENLSRFSQQKVYSAYGYIQHELGHIIGMHHTLVKEDTMYYQLNFGWRAITFTNGDISQLNALVKEYKKTSWPMYNKCIDGPGKNGPN